MRLLYIIAALAVFQIGVWTFTPEPRPSSSAQPVSAVAYGPNEKIFIEARVGQRQDAMKTLESPTGNRCTPAGHKAFISGLNYYYYQRQNEIDRHSETYGKLGADYIVKQWSTTDDKRVDRLTQEAYGSGYLKPDELEPVARKAVLAIVKNERITSKGCAG